MKKILVIGSINYDLVVKVDRIPNIGETVSASGIEYHFGGKGANQAVSSARLGGDTTFVSCIGDDEYGKICLNNLIQNNVNVEYVNVVMKNTGLAIINVSDFDNNIVVVPGANEDVSIKDVNISDYDLVVLQNEIDLNTNCKIINECYKNNIDVLYNPAPYFNIGDAIYKVKYLTPNEHEFELLKQDYDLDKLLDNGVIIIVTCGKEGATIIKKDNVESVSAPVVNVVDTTGAGDTFNGALAQYICEHGFSKNAVEFAVECASKSTTKSGAQTGMPYRKENE